MFIENLSGDDVKIEMIQTKDLCKLLGVSKNTAYKIVRQVGFPKIKIGKKFFIPKDELYNYLKKHIGTKIKIDND